MMDILRAEVMGFCFGVRRAIELAEAACRDNHPVHTLGPLVHNPQEIARLDAAGILAVDEPAAVAGEMVVIRAHGARPEAFDALRDRHVQVVDATCPFVTKSQRIAQELAREGRMVVIVGHPDHPEVQGILGYVPSRSCVITNPADVESLPVGIIPGVIAQTTVNEQAFLEVVKAIAARFPEHTVHNTVCSATRERQEAARVIAAQVDTMFVIGGRHSSNTNRLAEICRPLCKRTELIETADEIDPRALEDAARVGVTAGASTPDWLIEDVMTRLRSLAPRKE